MKKLIVVFCLGLLLVGSSTAVAAKGGKNAGCTTIQSGELYGSDGSLLELGYSEWGYNYQASMFNGPWCDYHPTYRPGGVNHQWCLDNMADVELMMKWSDEWLSNKDCNDDGKLDRGYSCDSVGANNSGCPGAWLTNHERGTYVDPDTDKVCDYVSFTKMITPDTDAGAYVSEGVWYATDGTEIGAQIWGAFAIIQENYTDSCTEEHGIQYGSPNGTGLGAYTPKP